MCDCRGAPRAVVRFPGGAHRSVRPHIMKRPSRRCLGGATHPVRHPLDHLGRAPARARRAPRFSPRSDSGNGGGDGRCEPVARDAGLDGEIAARLRAAAQDRRALPHLRGPAHRQRDAAADQPAGDQREQPGDRRPSRLHAPLQRRAREATSGHLLLRFDVRPDDPQRAGLRRAHREGARRHVRARRGHGEDLEGGRDRAEAARRIVPAA